MERVNVGLSRLLLEPRGEMWGQGKQNAENKGWNVELGEGVHEMPGLRS